MLYIILYIYILRATDKLTSIFYQLTARNLVVTHLYNSTTKQNSTCFGYP